MSTTSPASRRPRSSGSERAAILTFALVCAGFTAPPDHVVQRVEDGHIDWTARAVHVLGVGTPRILSPTGGLTEDDPYLMARRSAERRIGRVLARVPLDARRRLRDEPLLDAARAAAVKGYTAAPARHFSDGTVHLPASVGLDWVGRALTAPPPAPKDHATALAADAEPSGPTADAGPPDAAADAAPATGPTGLIVQLEGPLDPAFRVTVHGPAGGQLAGGLPGDSLGEQGVFWVTRTEQAVAVTGPRPHYVEAIAHGVAGPGSVKIDDPAFWHIVKAGVPGVVAVVVKR